MTINHQDYQELVPAQYRSKIITLDANTSKDGLRRQDSSPQHGSPGQSGQKAGGKGSVADGVQVTEEGVVVRRPEHLSNFTIDKPKIDFFKQAQVITTKLKAGERNRKQAMDQKMKKLAASVESKQDMAKENRKVLGKDLKERCQELVERDKEKSDAVVAVKTAWRKDVEAAKEVNLLRKQDQVESYQRGMAMRNMYKQVLADKLRYKYAKADQLKARVEGAKQRLQKANFDRFQSEARQANEAY